MSNLLKLMTEILDFFILHMLDIFFFLPLCPLLRQLGRSKHEKHTALGGKGPGKSQSPI